MTRRLIALLIILPILCAMTLVERLESDQFQTVSMPGRWVPAKVAERFSDHSKYPLVPMLEMGEMLVKNFVAVYGLPTAVLKPKNQNETPFLIYKLDGGYTIVVYLASLEGDRWTGAAMFRPDGETEGPLLK